MNRLRSVRGRITLAATALVAVTLLGASLLILRLVEIDLVNAAENTLADALEEQAILLEESGLPASTFEVELDGREYRLGLFTEGEDGEAFGELFDGDEFIADVVIDLDSEEIVEVFVDGEEEPTDDQELYDELSSLVFDVFEVSDESGSRLLVGLASLDEVDESVDALRRALVLIVPGLVIAFGLMTWWLVGRALRPVDAITGEVEEISGTDLDRRVPVPGGGDEIAHLATVMNAMLDRLEQSSERQRRFTSDASHELRTPLATIRTATEVMGRQRDEDRRQRLGDDVIAEVDRMDALIGDLLTLARLDDASTLGTLDVEVLDLTAVAQTVAEQSQDPSLELSWSTAEPVLAEGHRNLVGVAVRNLVANAQRHRRGRTIVSTLIDERGAVVRVDDDGNGIPVDQRTAVLEPFTRLDEARSRDAGGAGLGLALVAGIVRVHGGSVTIGASELGGARVEIALARMDQPSSRTSSAGAPSPPAANDTSGSSSSSVPLRRP